MASDDLTIEILRGIRDEVAGLRGEVAGTNRRLDETNSRLEGLEVRMGRVEHGVVDLGGFMRQLALDMAKYEKFHAHHVETLDKDVQDLKVRVSALEDRR